MTIDLSPWRRPDELVNAIWEARRNDRRDLLNHIAQLLSHSSPTVREEAASLVFLKWGDLTHREQLLAMTTSDPDARVRARTAGILSLTPETQDGSNELRLLRDIVLNRREEDVVRKSAYEGLARLVKGEVVALDDEVDIDEDLDLDWVQRLS
ncbi:MAG: HEAT repeat domain-containing protein [Gemmatimonadaceae bacterium]